MNSIVVFCGSNEGSDPKIAEDAVVLGRTLAQRGIILIYGGSKKGVMGKVAEGALQNNGEVIGVIPDFLMKKEVFHPGLSQLIITQNMHERKLKMHELSEGIITLPGGYGTMEELFEMITWAQIGLHQKPIGILNTHGFYDDLLQMLRKMVQLHFLKQEYYDIILVDEEVNGLLQKMEDYIPISAPTEIKKDQI